MNRPGTLESDGVLWRREGLSDLRYLVYFSSFPQGDLQHPNYIFHPNYFFWGPQYEIDNT